MMYHPLHHPGPWQRERTARARRLTLCTAIAAAALTGAAAVLFVLA